MSDKVKSRLMIAGAAFCAALFLFSGAMLAREYLDQKQSAEAFDEVAGLVKEDVELPALELADDPAQERKNSRLLKSMRMCTPRTAIWWAGFLFPAPGLIIPSCRPRITPTSI